MKSPNQPTLRTRPRRLPPHALPTAVLLGAALLLAGCGGGGTAAGDADGSANGGESGADLPELAAIGGAQDVWGFSFGFDASREVVREALGDPETVTEAPIQESGAGPRDRKSTRLNSSHYS